MNFKKSKYGNKKVTDNGITFDSKREYVRWLELLALQKFGLISDLKRQVSFDLIPTLKHGKTTLRKIVYNADFTYLDNGKMVIEDSKGFETDVFKLKLRLMLIKYPEYEFRIT